MSGLRQHRQSRRRQRGAALIIALALVMGLLLVVLAAQHLVVTQLSATKNERDYDRALMMAEAGANAYLNMLANGSATTSVTNYRLIPPVHDFNMDSPPGIPSLTLFKSRVQNSYYTVIHYPNTTSQTGYFAGQVGSAGATVTVVGFGWSNGVVRRVQISATSFNVFDWAAIYGLDPNGSSEPAWTFTGSTNVVGASGAEGYIKNSNNATWYDGPIYLAANGDTLNPASSFSPTVYQSQPNVPIGHSGTGTLANPPIRRLARSLGVETADAAANNWAATKFGVTTTAGVNYFQTNNNNDSTGLRYLVQVTNSSDPNYGKVRELNDPNKTYTIVPTTGSKAWQMDWGASNSSLKSLGMTNNETLYGIRAYPGNYYFQSISQSTSNVLAIRSYADGEGPGVDENGNPFTVYSYNWLVANPPNPNAGMSTEHNIRFWIGNVSSGNPPNTGFSYQTFMENPTYSSRFRVYDASQGSIAISGTNSNPPPLFRVNMLVYNTYVNNQGQTVPYGSVSIASNTYLYGSLIGWQISASGGATIQKQAVEGNTSGDRLTYQVTAWSELP